MGVGSKLVLWDVTGVAVQRHGTAHKHTRDTGKHSTSGSSAEQVEHLQGKGEGKTGGEVRYYARKQEVKAVDSERLKRETGEAGNGRKRSATEGYRIVHEKLEGRNREEQQTYTVLGSPRGSI